MALFPPELKPILTTLLLPPAGPLLLVVLGFWPRRLWRWTGIVLLWLLSCNAVAVLLAQTLLPVTPALTPHSAQHLHEAGVQAIVVLGGGMDHDSPEFGQPQLAAPSLVRLRYGAWLARQSGLPLAFSGGVGWAAESSSTAPEALGAQRALQDWGLKLRWSEDQSRDTAENARRCFELLQRDGVRSIVLVTHATHMPRAKAEFEAVGFTVLPAPTAFPQRDQRTLLEWLPSGEGLLQSRTVLRELLGLHVRSLNRPAL